MNESTHENSSERHIAAIVPGPSVFERIKHPGWHGCPGHGRHWFTVRGHVGVRTPRCVRCGFSRPGDLTSDDWMILYEIGWSGLTDDERAWLADVQENGWPEGAGGEVE